MINRGLFTAFFFPEGCKLVADRREGDNNGKFTGG